MHVCGSLPAGTPLSDSMQSGFIHIHEVPGFVLILPLHMNAGGDLTLRRRRAVAELPVRPGSAAGSACRALRAGAAAAELPGRGVLVPRAGQAPLQGRPEGVRMSCDLAIYPVLTTALLPHQAE